MIAQRIDPAEAEVIKSAPPRRGRPLDPDSVSGMLRSGSVVWLPGKTATAANTYRSALRDYFIRTRLGERDGVRGLYLWAERKAP